MLKQSLQQKLLQKLSPQQIQLMKLLQVPTVELEQRIKEEMEVNPALEEGADREEDSSDVADEYEAENGEVSEAQKEFDINDYMDDDIPSYKLSVRNKGADDEDRTIPFASGSSFQENLRQQIDLRNLTEKQKILAYTIIGNLDDDGYLRRELINMMDDLAFSQNIITNERELEAVLREVQQLDPPGVAARSLQECLVLQLSRKDTSNPDISLAIEVLSNHFEAFTKKHYDRIEKKLNLEPDDLKGAVDEIVRLNPKPGNSMRESSRGAQQIIPDFVITNDDDTLQLSLNARNAPELRVSRQYQEMLQTYAHAGKNGGKPDKKQKDAVLFVKHKIDSAKWFIDAIKQRQNTLLGTMETIMNFQRDYFLTGDETKLRPMILKDIAEIVGLDISTISRVANSKYVQTPFGTFLLKSLFSESLSTDTGEEVSTREVKKILQDSIEAENKRRPLTDDRLAKLLKDKGYNIARRTVAKYREQLNIPVARLRKEL